MTSDLARQRIDPGSDVGCGYNNAAVGHALVFAPYPASPSIAVGFDQRPKTLFRNNAATFTQCQDTKCTDGDMTQLVKANIYEISSDTHQLHDIPLHHFTI